MTQQQPCRRISSARWPESVDAAIPPLAKKSIAPNARKAINRNRWSEEEVMANSNPSTEREKGDLVMRAID